MHVGGWEDWEDWEGWEGWEDWENWEGWDGGYSEAGRKVSKRPSV